MDLTGKVALVTGGGRGIGRATALALARDGADVGVNYVRHAAEAEATVAAIVGAQRQALALRADVGAAGEVAAMMEALEARFGRLDILVNNAGVVLPPAADEGTGEPGRWDDSRTLARWDAMLRANLTGAYLCTLAATHLLRASGAGRIVNVASLAMVSGTGPAGYAASKAGLVGLTRALAQQLGPAGVTANVVAPGGIATDMTPLFYPRPEQLAQIVARTPLGRYGRIEDVAEAIAFLASPRAGFITGQLLFVDGGRSWSQQTLAEGEA